MRNFVRIFASLLVFLLANGYGLGILEQRPLLTALLACCFVLINVFPSVHNRRRPTLRLRVCGDGCELLIIFLLSTFFSAVYLIGFVLRTPHGPDFSWIWYLLTVIVVEAIVFWSGILRVYLTSTQLKLKWRLIGVICGWLPLVNLLVLFKIIRIALKETAFESEKILANRKRENDQVCRTKYPLLLVHGVFFRDFKYFNYWGRIPDELKKNGAVIYYGNQQSAASIADCGKEIAARIRQIVETTGCGKVNLIAHSKGGLDCRYAIGKLGAEKYAASLTTINTPHQGCLFADHLLSRLPENTRNVLAGKYNAALKKLGDSSPDFLAAIHDLTASACGEFNEAVPDAEGVFYQSVGSKLNQAAGGRFPLNFSYHLVKYFDGPNDGLVSADSFTWGEKHVLLTVKGKRGISHGDMIDLNRENIEGFDIREFYVDLVRGLKARGF